MKLATANRMVRAAEVRAVALLIGGTCLAWAVLDSGAERVWYAAASVLWLSAAAVEWYLLHLLRRQARREDGC